MLLRRLTTKAAAAGAIVLSLVALIAVGTIGGGGSAAPGSSPGPSEAATQSTSEPDEATAGATGPLARFPLGVFRGSDPAAVDEYEQWLGAKVEYVLDYTGRGPDWRKISDPSWVAGLWSGTDRQLVLSMAMLPSEDYSLKAGAKGDYDQYWRSFAEVMVAQGQADAVLRIGWEFNGPFFPWAASGKEDHFAEYWRRIVDTVRSVPGSAFTFDWCTLSGFDGADVERAYPGDDYVDYIGADVFDVTHVGNSPQLRWQDKRDKPYGLVWQVEFAAQHDKPLTYPEWGLASRLRDDLGGGDNVYFTKAMIAWMQRHPPAYAIYFEYLSSVSEHRLMDGQFPKSAEAFRAFFPTMAPPLDRVESQ